MPLRNPNKHKCTCGADWPCIHAWKRDDKPFPFLQLPGELRNNIYKRILLGDLNTQRSLAIDREILIEAPRLFGRPAFHPTEIPHNIFSVCKQIRQEARGIYYEGKSFVLYPCSSEYSSAFHHWFNSLGDETISQLDKVTFVIELYRNRTVGRQTKFSTQALREAPPDFTLPYLMKVQFGLQTVPPAIILHVSREARRLIGSDATRAATVQGRRGLIYTGRAPTMLVRKARQLASVELEARLVGNFGCGHKGWYSCKDLDELLEIFVEVVEGFFGS